ncbi:MAG TPA: pilin [Steroidobacteraceae bacterium]|jgi:type IV pilus assembly protein PilA|nr:pilin [Steroidobacteraceae bacterium]
MEQAFITRRMRGDILFGPLFFIGIIAAIAIPAYQDYTIRAQITEGLNLASAAKAAVAESFAKTGTWPTDATQLGLEGIQHGRYVTSVVVSRGTIFIRYGGQANGMLARHQVTLRPTITEQGDVIWSCGYAQDRGIDPRKGGAAPHATNVARKYLPSACRG